MKTYRKFKPIKNTNVGLPPPDHQYPLQNDVNKIAIKQPQTHHRHGPIFRKQGKRETKK